MKTAPIAKALLLYSSFATTSGFVPIASLQRRQASTSAPLQMKSHQEDFKNVLPKFMTAGIIAASALLGPINMNTEILHPVVPVASAVESRVVGELKGSGLVFKVCIVLNYIACCFSNVFAPHKFVFVKRRILLQLNRLTIQR